MNKTKKEPVGSAITLDSTRKDTENIVSKQIITEKEANLRLKELYLSNHRIKFPNIPEACRCTPSAWQGKPSNALTRKIIDFLRLSGHWAERNSNTGFRKDSRKTFVDVVGITRTIGSSTWIKGSGTRGTADLHCVINGKSVMAEIKIGADRQSERQKEYQKNIERAGACYIIVKSFADFVNFYDEFLKNTHHGS